MRDSAYCMEALANADDLADADGKTILTFGQAFEIALAWKPDLDAGDEDRREPLTVRRAVDRYLEWYKVHRRAYDRIRPEAAAVHFRKTKTGGPRYVYLADEGLEFFEGLAFGRNPADHLLVKADGEPWGRNHHYRPMKDACEIA